eukprot:IDg4455t1
MNFIAFDALPKGTQSLVKREVLPCVRDANGGRLKTMGTIDLVVQLGCRVVRTNFVVCYELATACILGCDYLDQFVIAIAPRLRSVLLDDGSVIPIIKKHAGKQSADSTLLVEASCTARQSTRRKSRCHLAHFTELEPESQQWVELISPCTGTFFLETLPR